MRDYTLKFDRGTVSLYETRTEQVLEKYTDSQEARAALHHLRQGVGFNGWTPSFVLNGLKSPLSK